MSAEFWTESNIARLTALWAEGKTADVIAAELRISRNAVLAKVRRLREQGHSLAERGSPIIRPLRPTATAVTFRELTERTCRWPLGGTHDPVTHFCGKHSAQDEPYCAEHAARAYDSPKTARVRALAAFPPLRSIA